MTSRLTAFAAAFAIVATATLAAAATVPQRAPAASEPVIVLPAVVVKRVR